MAPATPMTLTSPALAPSPPVSLRPQCAVCPRRDDLARCTRCQVVFYCGREHQRADFAAHKRRCKATAAALATLRDEELALRNQPADMFFPDDVFNTSVGHFWGIIETRDYMRAKAAVISCLAQVPSPTATRVAADEALDCLRLCRSDNMGMRDVVPSLLLRLGRLQECYDFIKWWATCDPDGTYDWGNMDLPYLDVRDADVTEPVDCFEGSYSLEHLAALTFIKLTVARRLGEALTAHRAMDASPLAAIGGGLDEAIGAFLPFRDLVAGTPEPEKLVARVEAQARAAMQLTHTHNAHFWPAITSPGPLLATALPGCYSSGDRSEARLWLETNVLLWGEDPAAMAFVRANLGSLRAPPPNPRRR